MTNKTEFLKTLIDEWGDYTSSRSTYSMADFAESLVEKHGAPQAPDLPDEIQQEIERESLNNTVAGHLGLLTQLSNVWIKLTFRDTAFKGFAEYGITQFILHNGNPKKSEVVSWAMQERSTSFEMLRRLEKQGIIEEFPDEKDRRAKRVSITTKGKAALAEADPRVDQISRLLMGDLSEQKKLDLLKLLLRLNDFHLGEYAKGLEAVEERWFTRK